MTGRSLNFNNIGKIILTVYYVRTFEHATSYNFQIDITQNCIVYLQRIMAEGLQIYLRTHTL